MPVLDSANRKSDISEFCVTDDRLYLATRAWILWLQGLFSQRPPNMYKWSENDTESEILIYDHNPTSTEQTNKRPFITTRRGVATLMGSSRDQTMTRDFSGDNVLYSDIMQTSMSFTCVAREGIEAQEIAYLVSRMIPVFKASIQKAGRIHWISNQIQVFPETSHGEIIQGSSHPEWRAVQVSVPFSIQDVISAEKGFYNVLRAVNLHMGIT